MLADSLLYFAMSLRGRLYEWYPRTLVYSNHHQTFDFYTRLKSKTHFEKAKALIGVKTEAEYKNLVQAATARHSDDRYSGSWNERSFPSLQSLAKIDSVCSVP